MAIEWISGYPLITDNTSGSGVIASGAINQSGMIWHVIVPSASGIPTSDQVMAGTASGDVSPGVGLSGSVEASASGTAVILSGYNLSQETSYVMYVVASGYDDGLMASPTGLAFTTPDVNAPSWVAGYPTIGSITTSTATVSMNMNDAGSGYFVILPASSTAYPTATQIRAGTDGNNTAISAGLYGNTALTSGTVATVSVTNLAYSTQYAIYYTAQDNGLNGVTGAGGGQPTYTTCGTFRAALPNPGPVFTRSMGRRARDRRRRRNQSFRNLMNRA